MDHRGRRAHSHARLIATDDDAQAYAIGKATNGQTIEPGAEKLSDVTILNCSGWDYSGHRRVTLWKIEPSGNKFEGQWYIDTLAAGQTTHFSLSAPLGDGCYPLSIFQGDANATNDTCKVTFYTPVN